MATRIPIDALLPVRNIQVQGTDQSAAAQTLNLIGDGVSSTTTQNPDGTSTLHVAASASARTTNVDAASPAITQGYAVMPKNGKATLANSAALPGALYFSGLALAAALAGGQTQVVTQGPVDPAMFNLGAGVACAVGSDANGKPVRVTDPTCVSHLALKYLGVCDANGTIYVSPRRASHLDPSDFGVIPSLTYPGTSPSAFLDDAHDAFLRQIGGGLSTLTNQAQNRIVYPAGFYAFKRPIGVLANYPSDARVMGHGTSDQDNRGGFSASNAPFPGGTTFLFYGPGPGVCLQHGGGNPADDFNGRNGLIFEGIEVIGQNAGANVNVATTTGATVTVNAAAKTFTRTTGSWITDGYKVGDVIYFGNYVGGAFSSESFTNIENNSRRYITAVTPSVLTVADPYATLINETSAAAAVAAFANQYNDVALEVMGEVGIHIRDCRTGGFKIHVSHDGCEDCLLLNHHFDGIQGPTLGYSIADQGTDRGTDSAFCYRVGSFYFTSGVSGNQNTCERANFNANGWGFYTNSNGTGNVIRDSTSENGLGFGIIGASLGFRIQDCVSEGATVACVKIIASTSHIVVDNLIGTTGKPLVTLSATCFNLVLLNNFCRTWIVPPIAGASHIAGCTSVGNAPPYVSSGSAVAGEMFDTNDVLGGVIESRTDAGGYVGANCMPRVNLDVRAIGGLPGERRLFQDSIGFGAGGNPYSSISETVDSVTVAAGGSAVNIAPWTPLVDGMFLITLTVTASHWNDTTHPAYWVIQQMASVHLGTIALYGSPTTISSDKTSDTNYVAPTIGTMSSATKLCATINANTATVSNFTASFRLQFTATL